MDWAVLILSGSMEAVWAISLDRSEGFKRPLPTLVFFAALTLSMLGIGFAMKTLPVGTAYAVWTGIGAALTAAYAMISRSEPASVAKIVLITVLIACIVGLKLLSGVE